MDNEDADVVELSRPPRNETAVDFSDVALLQPRILGTSSLIVRGPRNRRATSSSCDEDEEDDDFYKPMNEKKRSLKRQRVLQSVQPKFDMEEIKQELKEINTIPFPVVLPRTHDKVSTQQENSYESSSEEPSISQSRHGNES